MIRVPHHLWWVLVGGRCPHHVLSERSPMGVEGSAPLLIVEMNLAGQYLLMVLPFFELKTEKTELLKCTVP